LTRNYGEELIITKAIPWRQLTTFFGAPGFGLPLAEVESGRGDGEPMLSVPNESIPNGTAGKLVGPAAGFTGGVGFWGDLGVAATTSLIRGEIIVIVGLGEVISGLDTGVELYRLSFAEFS